MRNDTVDAPTTQEIRKTLWRMAIRVSGTQMTITSMGIDQIGILAHITELLIRNNRSINIEEGYGFRMNDTYSSFFKLSGSEEDLNWLAAEMKSYKRQEPFPEGRLPETKATYDLQIIACDRPGLINTVSRLAADEANNINVVAQVSDTVDLPPTKILEIARIYLKFEIPMQRHGRCIEQARNRGPPYSTLLNPLRLTGYVDRFDQHEADLAPPTVTQVVCPANAPPCPSGKGPGSPAPTRSSGIMLDKSIPSASSGIGDKDFGIMSLIRSLGQNECWNVEEPREIIPWAVA